MSAHIHCGLFIRLPPEILLNIFARLGKMDLKSIRLTSQIFGQVGSEFLVDKIIIAPSYRSLNAVEGISNHPLFRKHVKRIIYDISSRDFYYEPAAVLQGLIHGCGPLTREARHKLQQAEETSVINNHPDWMMALEGLAETGVMSESFSMNRSIMSEHQHHQKLYENQQFIRENGLDLTAFENALSCLPNLQEVTLSDVAWSKSFKEDIAPSILCNLRPYDHRMGELLADSFSARYRLPSVELQTLILGAISRYGKSILSLTSSSGNSSGLCTRLLSMPAEDMLMLCNSFAKLLTLELSFSRYGPERQDLKGLGCGNLGRLFQAAKQLEHLRLHFDGFCPHSIKHLPLSSFIGVGSWPNLTSFRLVGMAMHLSELSAFVDRQKHTLRSIHLSQIHLTGGEWYQALDLLKQLTRLGRVKLRGLSGSGFSFAQRHRKYSNSAMEQYVLGRGPNPLTPFEPTQMRSSYYAQERFRMRLLRNRTNSKFDNSED
ncbi:MAG: hypothetical protein M1812_002921 [Candelaria pacifica]|nr:MAG: hypothetical protein M1812_002921 [Candelaria pacifica]